MSDFMKALDNNKIALVVSLARNDVNLAQAAIEAGADALKVHLNVHHHASGNNFGSFDDESENLKPIIALCKKQGIPIGVVPGTSDLDMHELKKISNIGFNFISMYDKDMDPQIINFKSINKLMAITYEYDIEWIKIMNEIEVDVLECSIMHPELYGTAFTMRDVLKLKSIRKYTDKPMLLPTQKAIKPEHIKILQEIGINGLMIGAVVTGEVEKTLFESTKKFRDAIDKL